MKYDILNERNWETPEDVELASDVYEDSLREQRIADMENDIDWRKEFAEWVDTMERTSNEQKAVR